MARVSKMQVEIRIIKVDKQQHYEEAKQFFVNGSYCLSLRWEICSFHVITPAPGPVCELESLTDLYPVNNNSRLVCSLEDVCPGGLGEDD